MSNPNPLPEDPPSRNPMPVRTPGLADALRRLAGNPLSGSPPSGRFARRLGPGYSSLERVEMHLREFRGLVQRQARPFAALFAGSAAALALLLFLQTPQFESTALLLVKVGRELIYNPEVGEQKAVTPSPRDKQTVINSEISIMRSEPVIMGVVDSVGLATLYPDLGEELAEYAGTPEAESGAAALRAKAGERLRESLVVLALPDADVLQVSLRHPDGAIAQKSVGALIDHFTQAHLEAFGEPAVVRFLEARVNAYRQSLDKAEGELREFEIAHPVFTDDAPPTALAKRLEDLRTQIAAIDAQISQVRLATVGENSALAQAQRDSLALELEAAKVKGHLRDAANHRIAVVNRFIAARKGEMDAQVGSLQQRRGELQTEFTTLDRERSQMPTLSSQYHDLRRERDAHEEQYVTYQKRLRDARFSHQMDNEKIASISVFQQATLAPEPIWPLPPALGMCAVLMLSFIVATLGATLADHHGWRWPVEWNAARVRDDFHRISDQVRVRWR
jgi:uncharacterized protein involved in exopolysaccharide biosynthesis